MFGLKQIVGGTALGGFLWSTRTICSGVQVYNGKINPIDNRNGSKDEQRMAGTRNYSCGDPCAGTKYMDLKCKIALITGGTSGIGLGIADSLLGAGLQKVYLSGKSECDGSNAVSELAIKHGEGKSAFIPLNVNNQKQFEDAFKNIICNDGSVDILVNNAGMLNDGQWELEIDTNVKGVMRGIILANKYMPNQKNKGGCVVNVASILGFDSFPYAPGYNCTKHAVVGFTKAFGDPVHYAKTRVRIIALGPGVTHTTLVHGSASVQLNEEWGTKTLAALNALPAQTADAVGQGTVYMIEYGPPGSLWVVEDRKLQRVTPPDRKTYQQKILDL